ncbi:MAG: diacylglycerol/lipid kinase family protein [Adhaeribacter sp.]
MSHKASIQKVLFVLNPISGDISKEEVQAMIEEYCAEHQIHLSFYHTTGIQDSEEIKGLIAHHQPDAVVAIGGDGTVSLVANILNHGEIPLGIIPLGSGNGLSKDIGIPQEIDQALALLKTGVIKKIDSLDINGETVFHLSDLGFNAFIVKKFNEGETRGPGAYAWIALQEYINYTPFFYKIQTDKEYWEGEAFMVTIANANAFGSNATINPSGIIDDGYFEICLIEPFPKAAAIGLLFSLYTDKIHNSVYSRILKCKSATIQKSPDDILQIDGELVDMKSPFTVKMNNESLAVLMPPVTEEE